MAKRFFWWRLKNMVVRLPYKYNKPISVRICTLRIRRWSSWHYVLWHYFWRIYGQVVFLLNLALCIHAFVPVLATSISKIDSARATTSSTVTELETGTKLLSVLWSLLKLRLLLGAILDYLHSNPYLFTTTLTLQLMVVMLCSAKKKAWLRCFAVLLFAVR